MDPLHRNRERHAHIPLPGFAKTHTRGHHNICLVKERLDAGHGIRELRRHLGPDVERGFRRIDLPPQRTAAVDKGITPLLLNRAQILDLGRIHVKRRNARVLDGIKDAGIHIRFDLGERGHQLRIAARPAQAPARHIICFGK